MALSIARAVSRLAVYVEGKVDAIVITGGIAYSKYLDEMIAHAEEDGFDFEMFKRMSGL